MVIFTTSLIILTIGTNGMNGTVYCDVTWVWDFKRIPPVFQRYVTLRASQRAATQLVSNPTLSQMLAEQATMQRAACIQEDCQMGQTAYMGGLLVLPTVLLTL